jgi:hypothetical protein
MEEYTPTTGEIRKIYVNEDYNPDPRGHTDNLCAEFDRWLNEVKAEAIRETATLTTQRGQGFVYVKDILEYARRVRNDKA